MGNGMGFHAGLHIHDELHLLGRILRIAERNKVKAFFGGIIKDIHLLWGVIAIVSAGFLKGIEDSLLDLFLAALGYLFLWHLWGVFSIRHTHTVI